MKKVIYLLSVTLAVFMMTSCEKSKNDVSNVKEDLLKKAVVGQVDGHMVSVYSNLSNAAYELKENCDSMLSAFEANHLDELAAQQKLAAQNWVAARRYWELSESFLFGPVSYYNVDPHIDSWPLDKDKLETLLARLDKGEEIDVDDLTYGTAGFHSLEYMLYDPQNADPKNVKLHDINSYTAAQLQYTLLVATDLAAQTSLLAACWVGLEPMADYQKELLEDFDISKPEFADPYRYHMTQLNSSVYKTYQAAAEEIVQGCIDIADEVGNTKMGTPCNAANDADRNYIESPYALNSIVDFQDNILSIKNSYCGMNGAYSISDYVKSKDAQLDTDVRAAIDNAIAAIAKIQEPFIAHAKDAETRNAVDLTGTVLKNKLEEVYGLLSKVE